MIFNSLGSNYNFGFVIKSLFSFPSEKEVSKLKYLLSRKYGGDVALVYKGREAIKMALEISGLPKGSKVGVNGLTCYVVNQALTEAGHVPVYLDIADSDLNFDIRNLEKHTEIKALIIQNTFGCPLDITFVKNFCKKNNILIIEDLAHSAGSVYPDGQAVGTVGDFVSLSFSQDKIIDGVSGGALIVRNGRFRDNLKKIEMTKLAISSIVRDRVYPLLTFKIRLLYSIGIGKVLHFLVKKLNILSDPMGTLATIKYHSLPNWHAAMALSSFENLDAQIKHRKEIAGVYIKNLDKSILSAGVVKNCNMSTNIRFPIFIEGRPSLIQFLKDRGIFVSDIWYDAPIAPKKLIDKTQYNGECPKAEIDGAQILNLPTHINVTNKDAERISREINKWLNTNQK